MKIGILTLQFSLNYGAVIQLWALKTYLERKGHEVIVFNYEPYIHKYPRWILSAYGFIHHPGRFLKRVAFSYKFSQFLKRNMKLSQRIYRGDMFPNLNLDVVLVGSDQVWNVGYFKDKKGDFDKTYFLDFVKNGHKVAYAASIGEGWCVKDAVEVKRLLSSFYAISVRESFALEEIKKLGIENVCSVCDPTALIGRDEYLKLANHFCELPDHFVFVYALGNPKKCFDRMLFELKADGDLVAVVVVLRQDIKVPFHPRVKQIWPAPKEWLGYLASAKLVITNSFHGLLLSIILGTKVLVYAKENEKNGNDRMQTILAKLNGSFGQILEFNNDRVEKLMEYRDSGIAFLNQIME